MVSATAEKRRDFQRVLINLATFTLLHLSCCRLSHLVILSSSNWGMCDDDGDVKLNKIDVHFCSVRLLAQRHRTKISHESD